ncbi:MAG: hypothetical protein MUF06_01555 [Pirellulaceae bacterium]|jgi:hypothetical protein|nr:hypothetical protein [Pirellulaceae bacterium]
MIHVATKTRILEALDANGRGLRVSFVWWADRFGHVVSIVSSDEQIETVLNSHEGDASDAWPPSPPLQSLSVEYLGDGRSAALLVGMAGKSHWSASVEAVSGRPSIVFDIACRVGDSKVKLASRYRVAAGDVVSPRGEKDRSSIEIEAESGRIRIVREVVPAAEVQLRLPDEGDITIRPRVTGKPESATVRWKYRIELLNPLEIDGAEQFLES